MSEVPLQVAGRGEHPEEAHVAEDCCEVLDELLELPLNLAGMSSP